MLWILGAVVAVIVTVPLVLAFPLPTLLGIAALAGLFWFAVAGLMATVRPRKPKAKEGTRPRSRVATPS